MIFQHPLAYLVGIEGLALLRAWAGEGPSDEAFVQRRMETVRRLLADEELIAARGALVTQDGTAAAYAQWASTYDGPDNGLFALDQPVIDDIIATLPVGTALDAACGTGRVAARLAGRGFAVTGVDDSAEMLGRARAHVPDAELALGNLESLPFPDGRFDLVTTALALTHVPDLGSAYGEFARVLRPGGDLVVSDVHPDLVLLGSTVKGVGPGGGPMLAATHRHGLGDHLRAALAAGFTVLRYEERPRPALFPDPLPAPTHDVGAWSDWPWTLLGWDPEATRSAWASPAIVVWHFRRSAGA